MPRTGRIHFLDEWRGVALIGMIIYHTLYDLYAIFGVDFDFFCTPLNIFQQFICCSFILIAGISARLSSKILRHGATVFGAGMLMTAGTYIFMRDLTIWFGVLHMIGLSLIICSLIKKPLCKISGSITAAVSVMLFLCLFHLPEHSILFGSVTVPSQLYIDPPHLAFLGLPGKTFSSSDYFPLIPWFFLFMTGFGLGEGFKERKIPEFMTRKHSKFLSTIGSNTLIIYIFHQPVIYGILYGIFYVIEQFRSV